MPIPPVDLCNDTIKGIKSKADHNKRESQFCFALVIVATLLAPLFIAFGPGLVLGKIIPSVLSVSAAASTAWLQLRKPQQLWALYRTAQRELEDERTRFEYRLGDYKTVEDPEKLLATRVADSAIGLHQQWLPLVPNPENLQGLELSGPASPTLPPSQPPRLDSGRTVPSHEDGT